MRTKFYLPFIALALMATSCNSKKRQNRKAGFVLQTWIKPLIREMIFISMRVWRLDESEPAHG